MAGLLFLAFAYFAVGQAAVTRNAAQTAADAAALAAAQDAREQLRDGWLDVVLDPSQWDAFVRGDAYDPSLACGAASDFADRNGAALSDCDPLATGGSGFSVTVSTTGAGSPQATATADAVVEARCWFEAPAPTPPPTPPPTPTETEDGESAEEEESAEPIVGLNCDGEAWVIDPEDPKLPDARELFTVRLSN